MSDVNLCIDIWVSEAIFDQFSQIIEDEYEDHTRKDIIILAVALGSAIFVVVPYMANLFVAVKIKKYIKTNEAAKAWYDIYYHLIYAN